MFYLERKDDALNENVMRILRAKRTEQNNEITFLLARLKYHLMFSLVISKVSQSLGVGRIHVMVL